MARKRLTRDQRGLEGLPLHLMVGMAALLLTVPPALASFGAIQDVMERDRIERELERLIVCSKQVALGAPGGVRIVELDLDHLSIHRVRIGGSPMSRMEAMTVAYSLRGGRDVRLSSGTPLVFWFGEEQEPLFLGRGVWKVRVEKLPGLDLDGDGWPELCLMVSMAR